MLTILKLMISTVLFISTAALANAPEQSPTVPAEKMQGNQGNGVTEIKLNEKPAALEATKTETTAAAEVTAAPSSDLKVLEFVLANQVEQREPKDVVEAFAAGSEKAFAFARLNANAPSEVTFVWYRNNKIYTQYTALIQPAKTWRTYSSIKLKSGDWKVQLLGKNKEVLAEKTFTIQ
jgi:hypothetical protein